VVNPDQFLQTESGRVWTPERSQAAWQQSYDALKAFLSAAPDLGRKWTVVIVCGLQGSGKSTWIAAQPIRPCVIYFDAALPGVRHRAPIIEIAKAANARIEIIWIKAELTVALARNMQRRYDERVSESSILSVAELFEEPTPSEGVDDVKIVDAGSVL
jgi:hypothetical protein